MPLDRQVESSLLQALKVEEENLLQAIGRLRQAQTEHELATSRYTAVRDLVTRRIGKSPYISNVAALHGIALTGGQYRFLGMNTSEAAVQVLKESERHLSLEEVIDKLRSGGLRVIGLPRSVNAALMNKSGVKTDGEGNYFFEEDEGDIPFE